MRKRTKWCSYLVAMAMLVWIGCGPIAGPPEGEKVQPVPEVLPEANPKHHTSPLGPGSKLPPGERPDDKPDDPALFDSSNSAKWIGDPCTKSSECAFPSGYCMNAGTGFPNGYCVRSCTKYCPDRAGSPFTFCVKRGSSGMCFSRCDTKAFPGTGCRAGYKCREEGRFGQSSVKRKICVPDPNAAPPTRPTPPPTRPTPRPTPPPTRPTPPSSSGALKTTPGISCYDQLTKWGVKFTKTSNPNTKLSGASKRCSVDRPLRLHPPVLGVDYVIWDKRRISMLVSCPLALKLAQFSHYLKGRGITKVMHYGTYNCRRISGSSKLSNHSFGGAIDLAGFWSKGGTEYNVVKHWDHNTTWRRNGNMGCWSTRFKSDRAKVLYQIGCDMWKKRFFSLVLSPNYNRAHDDHFHVDLTSSGKILSDAGGYIGTYDHNH